MLHLTGWFNVGIYPRTRSDMSRWHLSIASTIAGDGRGRVVASEARQHLLHARHNPEALLHLFTRSENHTVS